MRRSRVAVTGTGVVSSIGNGFEEFTSALLQGSNGAGPVTAIDTTGFRSGVACEVTDFSAKEWFRRTSHTDAGRAAQFAVAAARMAVADAFDGESALSDRLGAVVVGSTDGGSHELDQLVAAYEPREEQALDLDLVRQVPLHRIAGAVAAELGLRRSEAFVVGSGCAAGGQAIGLAADMVASGDVEFAVTGGADALCRRGYAAFSRLNLMAPDLCRPFSVDRKGLLLGEGAGILVLEDLEHARARGATIYAELIGYAANCDRHHPVHPVAEGVATCIQAALDSAGLAPSHVDFVSAHGTGTPTNDVTEAQAMRSVFGVPPPVAGVKSMLGHTMGAAGAMGALSCITAIQSQQLPPTINHTSTDPACEIDCVTDVPRPTEVNVAQCNALGFFGNNAVLLFKRVAED